MKTRQSAAPASRQPSNQRPMRMTLGPALTAVGVEPVVRAPGLVVYEAAPNPFNPSTRLSFEFQTRGHVKLSVYDSAGRLVRTLADGVFAAGRHDVTWEGRDDRGRVMASGVYLYRVTSGAFEGTRSVVLLK